MPLFERVWHIGGAQFPSADPYNIPHAHPELLLIWRQSVRAETKELWLDLCERTANEQDADRLLPIDWRVIILRSLRQPRPWIDKGSTDSSPHLSLTSSRPNPNEHSV
jgi:hypothetical protein